MKHRDYIFLQKANSELDVAKELLGDATQEDFESDEMKKRALCMTVINSGELIKNISDEAREKHNEVPWKSATGFRDMVAHKYQTLSMGDVYVTVKNDFPGFQDQIRDILDQENDERR